MIDDLDEVHEIYRDWRRVADSYDPPRVFVAEAWVTTPERLARYLRPDELHTAFNFHYLQRHVSRFGRPDHAQHKALSELRDEPFDLVLGPVVPERPRCCPWRCRATCTCTRARSWGCGRSRICRRRCCGTPPGSTRGTRIRGGTVAGCRCRGPGRDPLRVR